MKDTVSSVERGKDSSHINQQEAAEPSRQSMQWWRHSEQLFKLPLKSKHAVDKKIG